MLPPGTSVTNEYGLRMAGGREIAARAEVQRQRVQVLARHARGDLGALRVEHRGIGDDVDFFGEIADLQLRVDPGRLPDEDPDALLAEAAKAGQLDVQVVGADGHLGQRVVAGLGRHGLVPRAVFRILRDHARARHDGAVGIDDGAGNGAAIALRVRAGREQEAESRTCRALS